MLVNRIIKYTRAVVQESQLVSGRTVLECGLTSACVLGGTFFLKNGGVFEMG